MAYYGWRDGWYDPWQPRDTWHWQEDDWQWSAWQHRDEAWQQRDDQMGSWQAEGQEGWRHSDRQDEPDAQWQTNAQWQGRHWDGWWNDASYQGWNWERQDGNYDRWDECRRHSMGDQTTEG